MVGNYLRGSLEDMPSSSSSASDNLAAPSSPDSGSDAGNNPKSTPADLDSMRQMHDDTSLELGHHDMVADRMADARKAIMDHSLQARAILRVLEKNENSLYRDEYSEIFEGETLAQRERCRRQLWETLSESEGRNAYDPNSDQDRLGLRRSVFQAEEQNISILFDNMEQIHGCLQRLRIATHRSRVLDSDTKNTVLNAVSICEGPFRMVMQTRDVIDRNIRVIKGENPMDVPSQSLFGAPRRDSTQVTTEDVTTEEVNPEEVPAEEDSLYDDIEKEWAEIAEARWHGSSYNP
ncbi:hypothetical protein F5Y18DRAFT_393167 [Xylariaceae sp. FL1019]|nr:hypothetical protein F5Y18DRAFT_393167 [Xylariaceae sp. FL1019]